MTKKLIIIGASGHGKVVADIAKKNGYVDISFLDDDASVESCGIYKVVGACGYALQYEDCHFIVAIGKAHVRKKIQKQLIEFGLQVISLIHPNAVVAECVEIGMGTVVMAGAVINPYTKIGQGCIINTCSSVDHDCIIGEYAHISVGAHIAGTVDVGENTWIGAGATVSNNVRIVSDCIVGAGAVVVDDIVENGTYVGIPARKIK